MHTVSKVETFDIFIKSHTSAATARRKLFQFYYNPQHEHTYRVSTTVNSGTIVMQHPLQTHTPQPARTTEWGFTQAYHRLTLPGALWDIYANQSSIGSAPFSNTLLLFISQAGAGVAASGDSYTPLLMICQECSVRYHVLLFD